MVPSFDIKFIQNNEVMLIGNRGKKWCMWKKRRKEIEIMSLLNTTRNRTFKYIAKIKYKI